MRSALLLVFPVKYLPRIRLSLMLALLVFSSLPFAAQTGVETTQSADDYVALLGVRVVHRNDMAAIVMMMTKPVVPVIQRWEGPPRIVIDLPGTRIALKQKRISVRGPEINEIRADQYQANPPVTRVVVDLVGDRSYTWNSGANRLFIRLGPAAPGKESPAATSKQSSAAPNKESPAATNKQSPTVASKETTKPQPETPSVVGLSSGSQPAVVPVTSGNSGTVVLGSRVAAGSAITAGAETTVLKLSRGGEIRVCPGTTVSLTSSKTGRDLMLGMSTGSLETHYILDASADSILTPDFRILMPGPGEFDYAVSADARGNTCVRALRGNTASVVISELMGERTYQVRPNDELLIHSGRLDRVDTAGPFECGCPAPAAPILSASTNDPVVIPDKKVPSAMTLGGSAQQPEVRSEPEAPPTPKSAVPDSPPRTQVAASVIAPETAPLPPAGPRDMRMRIEAPLVYRATDPPPAPTQEAARLPIMRMAPQAKFQTLVLAPPEQQKRRSARPDHHGFFGKLKGLFSAMFG